MSTLPVKKRALSTLPVKKRPLPDSVPSFGGGAKRPTFAPSSPTVTSAQSKTLHDEIRSSTVALGTLEIYTDGSFYGAKQQAGVGIVIVEPVNPEKNILEIALPYSGPLPLSNQRSELWAIYTALQTVLRSHEKMPFPPCVIVTDSEYAIGCLTKWSPYWIKHGWKTKSGSDVKNKDIIQPILKILKDGLPITFRWVKGHDQNEYNQIADRLAKEGAERYS